jgi:hypothetical protein
MATQRPSTAIERARRHFVAADFPDPRSPRTRRFGEVRTPAEYSSNGSKQNAPPDRRSVPR